jgi:Na+-transporting NADH:ubiquinone oxidoreductase subunit B
VPAILFLVCDAPSGAATNGGRIAHGLLAGSLIAILGIAGGWAAPVRAAVFAALLASIFAPLIDRAVIAVHIRRRRRRLART